MLWLYHYHAEANRDIETAMDWCRRAADAGSPEAAYEYGA